ncbi:MAG: TraB/GumN family protein [Pseudomonadota bacterium]
MVTDDDSRVVLFPTIHILPPELEWQDQSIKDALFRADEVWFELLPSEATNERRMQQLAVKYGVDPQGSLKDKLDDKTYKEFSLAARRLGMLPEQLDTLRPWLAAITLITADLIADGFDPGAGAEMVLAQQVPVSKHRAFETADEQLALFAALSPELELALLQQTLEEIGRSGSELRQLATAWSEGDLSSLEELTIRSLKDVSEELYQSLLVRRNEAWAEQLAEEMKGSGDVFIAVGGGHLVGDDSLPKLMKSRGYAVVGPDL